MTEPNWRRLELDRKRLTRQCEKLITEAVRNGDIEMVRINRIRLAAMRFAFDGSVEAHRQLTAFNFADQRPLNDGDLRSILGVVEKPGMHDGPVLGVANPSPEDAKEFVFHASGFLMALQSGAQLVPRAVPRVRSPS
ncbi:MAG TPA: hypothetical protein VF405_16405 [Gammaproteobacteria bacterium]